MAFGAIVGLLALVFLLGDWRAEVSAHGASLLSLTIGLACAYLCIGAADDFRPIGPRLKFALFASVSFASAYLLDPVSTLELGGGVRLEVPYLLALAGTALWVFTLVNCVNFMDGANGLAMGSVAIGLVALAVLSAYGASPSGVAVGVCGASALAGFLPWNFPKARLFAGDSGALFAGALAALASVLVIHRTGLSPFIPPILFFPLLADALLTLAWRASRGRHLLDGHSEHLYQIAARAKWRVEKISFVYWAAAGLCGGLGVAAAFASSHGDPLGGAIPLLTLAGLGLAAILISHLVRTAAQKRGIAELQ